jgi:hypothetical protein
MTIPLDRVHISVNFFSIRAEITPGKQQEIPIIQEMCQVEFRRSAGRGALPLLVFLDRCDRGAIMSEAIGHARAVSRGRRIICDFLDVSTTVPTVSIQKVIDLSEVSAARKNANPRPSWCSIFTKAYAKVVASRPDLRRAFLTFPWERIFEYNATTADIVIEARLADEDVLVSVPLKHPESCPLLDIDKHLARCKENPVERVRVFREALFLARFPAFLRHWVMRFILNGAARARRRYFGTFGVTSVGNWGVESLRPLSPWTSLLHYGAIDPQGNITIRLTYDHRVLDGSGPSKALNEMEQVLKTNVTAELKRLNGEASEGLLKVA